MRKNMIFPKICMLIIALLLTSCATQELQLSESAEKDYIKGKRLLDKQKYSQAVLFLEKFSARYPYSQYTPAAELLRIEAAYKDRQPILSETLGLRFIDAHPNHKDRVYAEYLVAMSYYKESSDANHEQKFSYKALNAFVAINKNFPDNKYNSEIKKYIQLLTNRIARHEMIVGKFYFDKRLYVAATNRFIFVKNKFFAADVAPESLYWLTSSYLLLQQRDYALEISSLLQKNFPQNAWTKKAKQLM